MASKQNKKFFQKFKLYIIIGILFSLWIMFFDKNSLVQIFYLNNIREEIKEKYQKVIEERKIWEEKVKKIEDIEEKARVAREKYFLRRANEDIFLIEWDSITTKK